MAICTKVFIQTVSLYMLYGGHQRTWIIVRSVRHQFIYLQMLKMSWRRVAGKKGKDRFFVNNKRQPVSQSPFLFVVTLSNAKSLALGLGQTR